MESNQLQTVIEKGFKDLRAELDKKFEKVDARFEQIDARFERVDGKLTELRTEVQQVGDDARLAHVLVENLRHDLRVLDEGDSPTLEQRVSALEVRMTNLTPRRSRKKER